MPSTYTTNGGIELIANGEQSGTWGTTTNLNLQIIDRLTNGVGTISLSGTTHTLTTSDGALSDGQYAVLVFGGSPSGTNTVTISPNDAQHVYIVRNTTAQSVVLTQGSGGNVTVATGKSAIVYANGAGAGAAVVDVTSTITLANNSVTDAILRDSAALSVIGRSANSSGDPADIAAGTDNQVLRRSGTAIGFGAVNLASIDAVTGTLPVANGGTGQTSYTNGQLLIGNSTGNTLAKATLTAGTGISVTNGSGSITINATNNGTVTSVASGTGLTGGPITSSGTISVATNGITDTLLRDSTALSVIGRSANSTGDPADISAASDNQVLRRSGTSLGFGAINLASTSAVTGTLPVTNGGTGITSFGTGIATFLGTPTSANLAAAVTNETGSGSLVFATSPTLVTPVLGTPTSGNLSNCTADGTDAVGFRNIPQNSRSANYTLVLADSGKHILHPSADTTARTFTIPANSSVTFPVGTAVTFINQNGAGDITIAITTDTLRLAGDGSTGSRTLTANGIATAVKVTSTEWIISGVNLT